MAKMHSYTAQEAAKAIALQLAPTDERHRDNLETAYYRALMKALRAGLIVASSPTTHLPVPIDHPVPEVAFVVAKIKLAEVNRWLLKNDIPAELRAPNPEPAPSEVPESGSAEMLVTTEQIAQHTWEQKAVVIAQQLGLKRWARGERAITIRNIVNEVAKELAKDETTHGTTGHRAPATVRKHALKGWKFTPPASGANGANGASDECSSLAPPSATERDG